MSQSGIHTDRAVKEKTRQQTKEPSLYRVYLLNDDYTTMDFVVEVLEKVFHKPTMEATQIMLHVHRHGKGLAGVFTRDIAETKIETVHAMARDRGYPLKCSMEKE
ncbi:MAG: ATP-dependent Clp protease adaptor protein ClpS [Candidatus Ozemobacter sibiricus]|jgi:ATP-dependent Clp protease adaptor protein ClpS|uniref:ATP-dependent Clp protease adapter protein ClpS n=1 Tax=Candidatus Ozemobacter sibiricus TaxID=2268124 RepID=A0A367ZS48_9BACT|nr:MAG: ATP-dependent Clp protease adaptor protein ClpS [Candidatus Ozemobacter sibiricus]